MIIAYFGLPLAALLLLRDGHDIAFAALSFERSAGTRRLARLIGSDRVLAPPTPSARELEDRARRARADLVVGWFFPRKIPMGVVRAARLGGIGAHPSLLPRHRGPDPYFAAIDQGDEETGVTIHRIEAEYDTGAILAGRRLRIDPGWNAWQLARKLDRPSLALLRETVQRLGRGEQLDEEPQDEAAATDAAAPTDDDTVLSWSWSTARILRRIRALAPVPGAYTELLGHDFVVLEARAEPRWPLALAPGEASVVDGTAVVRTGDGAIGLLAGELDGVPVDRGTIANLVSRVKKTASG